MDGVEANRRLCALVAVDMAGYSGRAETDEDAAVGLVSELSKLVHEAAGVLGGRVFNTAGDGFMLEFPTVTNALTAAEAIRAGAPAPVRIGLHLGEVAVAPSGDLLGHGVNVAARLQQAADPGEMLISDEVKRALRGPLAERLEPIGRMRLAKMKEERVVYRLKGTAPVKGQGFRAPPKAMLMVALALLICGGLLAWRIAANAPAVDPLLAAVKSFQSSAGPGAGPAYGSALADRLTSALADRQAPVVSRDLTSQGKTGKARLLIGGTVERDGPQLRVTVRMDDAQSGQALWTSSFERSADEDLALQRQVAVFVSDVIVSVRDEIGPDARDMKPEVLAAYVKAVDLKRRNRGAFEQQRQAFERLAALAPQSSRVHSSLAVAISLALGYTEVSPEQGARWRTQAVAEANRALEIDPRNSAAYLALMNFTQPLDYEARDALMAKAKAADPDDQLVLSVEGNILKDVGRLKASVVLFQQAVAKDTYNPGNLAGLIFGLHGVGRHAEAEAVGARAADLLPDNGSIRRANLFTAVLFASPNKAAAAIDLYQEGEPRLDPVSEQAWRDLVAARAGKLSGDAAAKALRGAPRNENGVAISQAISAFAMLGKLDDAFAEADRAWTRREELHFSSFFEPETASMRLDSRFMPLMARLGLVGYWRRTGLWPDFCEGPDRPYDCKAKADEMVPAKVSGKP